MPLDKYDSIRRLVPISHGFDGYNELKCPNSRDRPFFSDNVIPLGAYNLKTRLEGPDTLYLEFDSVCSKGKIMFARYKLTLEEFVTKLREAARDGSDYIALEIQTVYSSRCAECSHKNKDCTVIQAEHPSRVMAQISFVNDDIKSALSVYFGITNKKQQLKGGNQMNNLFGLNFEFGLSKDPKIASTLMGVAVKSASGNWIVFDRATNTRKDFANMQMGDFPVFLLPTKKLEIGDLAKMEGKYYYVRTPAGEDKTITLLGAEDGNIVQKLPSESLIPGLQFYTKVVAFDPNSLMNPSSKDNMGGALAAILMMGWAKGKGAADFSFDSVGKDSFNGFGSIMPMLMLSGGGLFGGKYKRSDGMLDLPLLMAMGAQGENGGNNDMMQMLLLNQLMGGESNGLSDLKLPGMADEGEVKCPKCNKPFPGDTKFCPECGTKTVVSTPASAEGEMLCPKCDKTFPADTKFCPECGTKTVPSGVYCRGCNTLLKPGATFCHNCGQKVGKATCVTCGKTLEDGEKFCSQCGTPRDAMKTEKPPKTPKPAKSAPGTQTPAEAAKPAGKKPAASAAKPTDATKV